MPCKVRTGRSNNGVWPLARMALLYNSCGVYWTRVSIKGQETILVMCRNCAAGQSRYWGPGPERDYVMRLQNKRASVCLLRMVAEGEPEERCNTRFGIYSNATTPTLPHSRCLMCTHQPDKGTSPSGAEHNQMLHTEAGIMTYWLTVASGVFLRRQRPLAKTSSYGMCMYQWEGGWLGFEL